MPTAQMVSADGTIGVAFSDTNPVESGCGAFFYLAGIKARLPMLSLLTLQGAEVVTPP